jgi:hypothetical protein
MRQIRLVWPAVLVSIAVIGTTACGQHVHVRYNNGKTAVHVGGSQDRSAGARDGRGLGTGRHR